MGINSDVGLQLASYTIGSSGDLTSTNTKADMPTIDTWNYDLEMKINPAGNVLAVTTGTGIQFFHFNGAGSITTFTGVIGGSGAIISMAWSGNTLYAVNNASGKLHVYDVSTTKVVEAAGSPYSLGALSVFVH
jgi:WD40 repeat protein